ncbi:hypothetical protein DTO013E5_2769 [Penicillium roqueforti]|uniref:uncharacterized protein n=1 Tax=Penicillium roqueforti TaxID=5082 RepID=UPI001909750A|nr:uncharacterized protein LCP9604111_4569 [Penicillium roqueforti]KAF9249413.1 hypothetical protein LCP9604111_4569 [Penicillium roqueforti]KAI1834076.1 hypothetical protein CBS147337_5040 [Penicillium roqueforti]KAI2674866.1 hypothetical protein CBS147355_6680 [Penicillium roqueforti]KAI2687926.1 hypothetical protein LCP963914a_3444 [Penicillium roqueforti]KAI2699865.1 hypothetical protein CBS147372_6175 [Penicillium roqueforti]
MVLTAAIFVTIRLATRIHLKKFGWDDLFLVIALAASVMTTIAVNLAVVHGYGRRKADMGEGIHIALKWFFVAQIPYKIALGFTKASIVLLYLRVFITESFQRVGKGFLTVIAAWTVASVLVTIFQCIPIEASWNHNIKVKQCVDKDSWWYAFAGINTVTDVLIAILPIPPVRHLKLSKRDRIGLCFVFGVGAFVCVTSIMRTVAVSQTSTGLDQSWDFIPRSVWTLVECNMGIICACLPMMRRPLSFLFPWLFRGSSRNESERLSYVPIELRYTNRQLRPRGSQSQEEILQSDVRDKRALAAEE